AWLGRAAGEPTAVHVALRDPARPHDAAIGGWRHRDRRRERRVDRLRQEAQPEPDGRGRRRERAEIRPEEPAYRVAAAHAAADRRAAGERMRLVEDEAILDPHGEGRRE